MTRSTILAALAMLLMGTAAQAQTVEVFAAGSLRGVVGDLAMEAGPSLGLDIHGEFGSAGLMRERIEKGEKADLFLSADMDSPRKLEAEGRTVVPVAGFARNHMCVIARKSLGLTADNLADRLLDQTVRIKTSQPVADPSGDYAWQIFDRIDALHPGAGKILKDKAETNMTLAPPPGASGQNPLAALFATGKVDVTFAYCSGVAAQGADIASFPVPDSLDPHPVFGMAVLVDKPEALRLALYLFSDKGQALLVRDGFIPLRDSARR